MYQLLPGGPWSLAFFTGRQKEKRLIIENKPHAQYIYFINLSCHFTICTVVLLYEIFIPLYDLYFGVKRFYSMNPPR